MTASIDWMQEYLGSIVVIDLVEQYLAIGRLAAIGPQHVRLEEADLHDHREANSTKDMYLIETRKFGIRANRKRVDLPRQLVIAISRLDDINE